MSYKLVAVDMDDTLLDENQQISKKNREVISSLLDQKINIVLASGRPYASLATYADNLGVVLPLITANGSLIKCSLTDKIYHKLNLNLKYAQEILTYAQEYDYEISVYYEDKIITNYSARAKLHRELKEVNNIVLDKNLELESDPIKLLLHHQEDEILEQGFKDLEDKYEEQLYITSAGVESIEVMTQGANKGNALTYIMNKLNIKPEEVIAIGNGDNDLPMFEVAGLAVAMGNSLEQVKQQADFVTKSNQQDGVAYALEKFILGDKNG
ncbi:HAD-superfamily hydrolase, subfamily IIB [Halobacteroides halobius DSM 5150]|uniref:HAD-superfamily hydrolase, subfamily IIB n=1 Tax=Halobacteroides halobius (strain ATCC 35273 / DSM 5150 / MD-1) TaxID=748449 RepID=L0KB22_HALHC|nr:Cof-type HAD-IIB family hydrolase [Halobacteroides halobius]AGB41735.1 HAD-superfamily hydrolase, subfamily IIB [Halobacteroides halobius DSM 5150]